MRSGKQLLLDSRQYAREQPRVSWWCLLSTLAIFIALQAVIIFADGLSLRIAASVGAGLIIIRLFIIYHDHQHRTILKHSRFASAVMTAYGILTCNPPSIWRRSHDHHHKHNSKMYGAAIGSFPLMTVEEYHQATPAQRRAYAATRHPLTFLFGYFTVFLYGMCLRPLLAKPRAHVDCAVALALHLLLVGALLWCGVDILLLTMTLPLVISAMVGSYLFYAQHNFPDARIQPSDQWDYVTAALKSSSYMRMNPVLAWITGNIGYHHVHHLNHHIPFYRLPEAMAAMPELQRPGTTRLTPWDVHACLRLKLWDTDQQCLVPFPPKTKNSAAYSADSFAHLSETSHDLRQGGSHS